LIPHLALVKQSSNTQAQVPSLLELRDIAKCWSLAVAVVAANRQEAVVVLAGIITIHLHYFLQELQQSQLVLAV
jgi:hypothetical protein